MASELSFVIRTGSRNKNFRWNDLRNFWQATFGGEISDPTQSRGNTTFIWARADRESILEHAGKGLFDEEIRSGGGSRLLLIMENTECIYEFIPDIDLPQKAPIRPVRVDELSAAAPKVDLLLMTVTDIERKALLSEMDSWPGEKEILEGSISHNTYRLGRFGRYRAAQVESTMGSEDRDGARSTLQAAIDELQPKAVLLIGIAFGLNRKKQHLGDVIIAESVFNYSQERVGEAKSSFRSGATRCGSTLSERFRTRRNDWKLLCAKRVVKAYQGLLLSGPKLIANKKFRDGLVKKLGNIEPLGGEMEGAGAYEAAARDNVEVILVKGICDWADGHKNDRAQPFAAYAAVSLAKHVLSKPDVLAQLGVKDCDSASNQNEANQNKIDPVRDEIDPDFQPIIEAFKDGSVVPFLGSGINLYDRSPILDVKLNKYPNYPLLTLKDYLANPTKDTLSEIELVSLLIDRIRGKDKTKDSEDLIDRLMGFPCLLCHLNVEERPKECPILNKLNIKEDFWECPLFTEQNLAIAKTNLRFISQYFQQTLTTNPSQFRKTILDLYKNSQPNRIHRFFAKLLNEKSSNLPCKLIITTNSDNFLEQAFISEGLSFDVIFCTINRDPGDKKFKFRHKKYRPKDPKQDKKVMDIRTPKKYREFSLGNHPVILKLYGSLEEGDFVITEDQYIDYLLDSDLENSLPASILACIKEGSILFLGYSLNDYDLHILNQSWSTNLFVEDKRSWFIHKSLQDSNHEESQDESLEKKRWSKRNVRFIEGTLKDCLTQLERGTGIAGEVTQDV